MTTYDLAIIGGTASGIIMVLGGIVLLYKGAIKLEVASRDPALTVEMFERRLKLTTHAPALGLFIIGLLFVALSIYFAQPPIVNEIPVKGIVENIEDNITVKVKSKDWDVEAHKGKVHDVIHPNLDVLWVVISAPGYREHAQDFELRKGGVDLGKIQLEKAIETIESDERNIVGLPDTVKFVPLDSEKRFGIGVRP